MRKRDSIEWLVSQLFNSGVDTTRFIKEIEQAKAMHKEEHGQTWDKSMENFESRGRNEMRAWVDFDEYYNETFEQ